MSTTLKKKDGVSPWLTTTWYAFCQALYKGIEGEDWGGGCPESKSPLEKEGS